MAAQEFESWPSGIAAMVRVDLACFAGVQVLDSRLWGVEHAGRLLGVIGGVSRREASGRPHLWLRDLYVRPRYRGTGVSRLLMDAALRWCEAQPSGQRLLGVRPTACRRARHFAARWGFRPLWRIASACAEGSGYLVMERER